MAEPLQERVFAGLPAADGLVFGHLTLERRGDHVARKVGDPAQEKNDFCAAVAQAKAELASLIGAEDALAGEILEFQQALLEDDDLIAPMLDTIGSGTPAHETWRHALDREIADYRNGGDEYMTARAEDLLDLQLRVLRILEPSSAATAEIGATDGILIADDLTPSRFLELDWRQLRGAAIRGGSPTSHVAILARARGVPLLVGLDADPAHLPAGAPAVLDAESGSLIIAPAESTAQAIHHRIATRDRTHRAAEAIANEPAVTAAGESVRMLINVDDPALLDALPPTRCDGIGLTRTEFLFKGAHPPDEEAQLNAYSKVVAWAAGRPVTIRTLDAGGDKPMLGITPVGESNPFLGLRGVRLSLKHPDMFRVQLRALARAAALGPVKVMLPMVTVPGELTEVRRLLDEVVQALAREGVPQATPPLGMMVEVPAAALTAEAFNADFYSIGSNDLVQYVTAAARDNGALAKLADPLNPAVLELIARTVAAGRARGVDVSLCGDMASDPTLIPSLLDCGLRNLSVAPAQVGAVKLAVRAYGAATDQA